MAINREMADIGWINGWRWIDKWLILDGLMDGSE